MKTATILACLAAYAAGQTNSVRIRFLDDVTESSGVGDVPVTGEAVPIKGTIQNIPDKVNHAFIVSGSGECQVFSDAAATQSIGGLLENGNDVEFGVTSIDLTAGSIICNSPGARGQGAPSAPGGGQPAATGTVTVGINNNFFQTNADISLNGEPVPIKGTFRNLGSPIVMTGAFILGEDVQGSCEIFSDASTQNSVAQFDQDNDFTSGAASNEINIEQGVIICS